MHWDELVPIVHSMTKCFGIPKMVLIHCGGNDIGIDPCGKLLFHLKFAVYVISKMLPGSMIAYSNILPRRTWRYSNNRCYGTYKKTFKQGFKDIFITK